MNWNNKEIIEVSFTGLELRISSWRLYCNARLGSIWSRLMSLWHFIWYSNGTNYGTAVLSQYAVLLKRFYFSPMAQQPYWARASPLSRLHDHSRQDSSGGVIRPTQRHIPHETQLLQQIDIRAPRGFRTPLSQEASGRRLTRETARPLESACSCIAYFKFGTTLMATCPA
jgi:hypothetical protein